jgi:hypothetical protein
MSPSLLGRREAFRLRDKEVAVDFAFIGLSYMETTGQSHSRQGKFVLGNLSEKSTIAVISEARPIKWLCREQIYPFHEIGAITSGAWSEV